MIIKKRWHKAKRVNDMLIREDLYEGWFLFGIIPLYIHIAN